jgi:hypothetical protein
MITVNLDKAKDISHDVRRTARAIEFAPLDVKATIPSEAEAAEAARQEVRDRYTSIQVDINGATEVATLKTIIDSIG